METLVSYLPWVQITLAVVLAIAVLIQQRGASVGGVFGGAEGTIHYERRGFEKTLFQATVVVALLFVLSTFTTLLIQDAPVAITTTQPGDTTSDITIGDVEIETTTDTTEEKTDFPSLEDFAQ